MPQSYCVELSGLYPMRWLSAAKNASWQFIMRGFEQQDVWSEAAGGGIQAGCLWWRGIRVLALETLHVLVGVRHVLRQQCLYCVGRRRAAGQQESWAAAKCHMGAPSGHRMAGPVGRGRSMHMRMSN